MTFDTAKLRALHKAYDKAVASGADQFEFEGSALLVSYAKYLLEYLDGRLKA